MKINLSELSFQSRNFPVYVALRGLESFDFAANLGGVSTVGLHGHAVRSLEWLISQIELGKTLETTVVVGDDNAFCWFLVKRRILGPISRFDSTLEAKLGQLVCN